MSSPERAFDFWVGEWDVVRHDNGEPVGRNVITLLHDGHVLAENYSTLDGRFTGSSLTGFDADRGRWHQCWMDISGLVLDLYGGIVDGEMVMSGAMADGSRDRICWAPLGDGTVRQHWQQSTDDGVTWITAFDGVYRPRPASQDSTRNRDDDADR